MNDFPNIIALLLGAGRSVDVLTSDVERWSLPIDQDSLAVLIDSRLKLRYIIRTPWKPGGDIIDSLDGRTAKNFRKLTETLQSYGWEVRLMNLSPTINCVIVDGKQGILSNVSTKGEPAHSFVLGPRNGLKSIKEHFERAWHSALPGTDIEMVHEDVLQSSIPEIGSQIVTLSSQKWNGLIQTLASSPKSIYQLNPREFEEFVAELISRDGFDVYLTQHTRDGGRDIIASRNSTFGQHLYLVECKRYSEKRPVNVRIVREFFGVISQNKAVAGMLVTSSFFTKPALEFGSSVQMQMVLKDFRDLSSWIKQHSAFGGRFA